MSNESMYTQSGVNIHEGYRAVSKMKDITAKTKIPGVMSGIGSFASMFSLKEFGKYDDPILVSGTDGVGTKLKIAFELGIYNTIGIDAVAMVVNDVLCHGAKPMFLLDYMACGKLNADDAAQIVSGVAEGCKQAGCALVGGETAEMPGFYKDGDYDIAAFTVGVVEKNKIVDGSNISDEDILVGVDSSGFHSNGFSLLNKLVTDITVPFEQLYKGEIEKRYKDKSIGEVLLTPTQIYVKPIMDVLDKYQINGIANITGGGFYENIPRMFKDKFTASIEKNKLNITSPFRYIMECGVPEKEMFGTFNMGTSLVMAVKAKDAQNVVKAINEFENGEYTARIIGKVISFTGEDVCIV